MRIRALSTMHKKKAFGWKLWVFSPLLSIDDSACRKNVACNYASFIKGRQSLTYGQASRSCTPRNWILLSVHPLDCTFFRTWFASTLQLQSSQWSLSPVLVGKSQEGADIHYSESLIVLDFHVNEQVPSTTCNAILKSPDFYSDSDLHLITDKWFPPYFGGWKHGHHLKEQYVHGNIRF